MRDGVGPGNPATMPTEWFGAIRSKVGNAAHRCFMVQPVSASDCCGFKAGGAGFTIFCYRPRSRDVQSNSLWPVTHSLR